MEKIIDERLIELETRFSFQEDLLGELNEVIIRQQRQLDQNALLLRHLRSELDELRADQGMANQPAADEKPPHY